MDTVYENLRTTKIYQSPVFEVSETEVRLPNGRETTRFLVSHPGAAVILPVDAEGQILMIRQYRHAVGAHILEMPAGTLERNEDPLACAKREIVEEIGFRAERWTSLGSIYPAPGFCNELQHLYLAQELTADSAEADEDEIIEVCPMSVSAVEEGIASGNIFDGKTIACFCRARIMGLV